MAEQHSLRQEESSISNNGEKPVVGSLQGCELRMQQLALEISQTTAEQSFEFQKQLGEELRLWRYLTTTERFRNIDPNDDHDKYMELLYKLSEEYVDLNAEQRLMVRSESDFVKT